MISLKHRRSFFFTFVVSLSLAFPFASFILLVHAGHGTAGDHECSLCSFGPHFHVDMQSSSHAAFHFSGSVTGIFPCSSTLRSCLPGSSTLLRGPPAPGAFQT